MMEENKDITIYTREGKERFVTPINEGSTRLRELGREDYASLKFSTVRPVPFAISDWADINDERLYVVALPQPTYNNETDGYDYELRLSPGYKLWGNKKMSLNPGGPSEMEFKLTDRIDRQMELVMKSIKAHGFRYATPQGEEKEYGVSIDQEFMEDARLVNYTSLSITEALDEICAVFECEWWMEREIVCIGRCEKGSIIEWERGDVLSDIRPSGRDINIPTRLYAFGGTENLPPYYRKEMIFEVTRVEGDKIYDDKHPLTLEMFDKIHRQPDPDAERSVQGLGATSTVSLDNAHKGETITILDRVTELDLPGDGITWELLLKEWHPFVQFQAPPGGSGDTLRCTFTIEWTTATEEKRKESYEWSVTGFYGAENKYEVTFPIKNNPLFSPKAGVKVKLSLTCTLQVNNPSNFHGNVSCVTMQTLTVKSLTSYDSVTGLELSVKGGGSYGNVVFNKDHRPVTGIIPLTVPQGAQIKAGDKFTLSNLIRLNIPGAWFTPIDGEPIVDAISSNRLRIPLPAHYIDSVEGQNDAEAVEHVEIFEDEYPKQENRVSKVWPIERKANNADGSVNTEWFWAIATDDIPLDIDCVIPGNDLRIKFTEGPLNGMTFGAVLHPYGIPESDNVPCIEVVAHEDLGVKLPNTVMKPEPGNSFILLGWASEEYYDTLIRNAEQSLYDTALEWLQGKQTEGQTFDCIMTPEEALKGMPQIGQRVTLIEPSLFPKKDFVSRIIAVEYQLDFPFDNPKFTVGERIPKSRLANVERQVREMGELTESSVTTSNTVVETTAGTKAVVQADLSNQNDTIVFNDFGEIVGDLPQTTVSVYIDGVATRDFTVSIDDNYRGLGFTISGETVKVTSADMSMESRTEVDIRLSINVSGEIYERILPFTLLRRRGDAKYQLMPTASVIKADNDGTLYPPSGELRCNVLMTGAGTPRLLTEEEEFAEASLSIEWRKDEEEEWKEGNVPEYNEETGVIQFRLLQGGEFIDLEDIPVIVSGVAGRSIEDVVNVYLAGTSKSVPPEGEWHTDPQLSGFSAELPYLWGMERLYYSDGKYKETTPHYMASWDNTGDPGRGIVSITEYYYATVTEDKPVFDKEKWHLDSKQTGFGKNLPYLWNVEYITYTSSPLESWSGPNIIGHFGRDAEVMFTIDLDNEMDTVLCDKEGNVTAGLPLETTARMWLGQKELKFDTLTATAPTGVSVSANAETGLVRVTAIAKTVEDKFNVRIEGKSGEYQGWRNFTVVKSRAPWMYNIIANPTVIKKGATKTLDILLRQANGRESNVLKVLPSDLSLWISKDDGNFEKALLNSAINVSTLEKELTIHLCEGGVHLTDALVDMETVPVLEDGKIVSIVSQTILYALTNDSKQPADGYFKPEIPDLSDTTHTQYLWTKTISIYSDGTELSSYGVTRLGADGESGVGIPGTSSYLHLAYADNVTFNPSTNLATKVEGFTTTFAEGKKFIGVLVNEESKDPDQSHELEYKWNRYKGEDGVGIEHVEIKYAKVKANDPRPSDEIPTEAEFRYTSISGMGWDLGDYIWCRTITYYTDGSSNKTYSVSRLGDDGESGNFMHFAYAEEVTFGADKKTATSVKGFSLTAFEGANYFGIYLDDSNTADSTNWRDYQWSKFGLTAPELKSLEDRIQGEVSTSVSNHVDATITPSLKIDPPYLSIDSNSTYTVNVRTGYKLQPVSYLGFTVPSGNTWLTITQKSKNVDGSYTFEVATRSVPDNAYLEVKWQANFSVNGETLSTTETLTMRKKAMDGAKGEDGVSYLPVIDEANGTIQFQKTTNPTLQQTQPTRFRGADGKDVTITSQTVRYCVGTSGTTAPTGTWQTNVPTVSEGQYLWTRTTVNYSTGNSTVSDSVARQGVNGTNGKDGKKILECVFAANSQPLATWKQWAARDSWTSVNNASEFAEGDIAILRGTISDMDNTPCYMIAKVTSVINTTQIGISDGKLFYGEPGKTWKPTVDANGNLSWDLNVSTSTPTARNIRGPQGEKGADGQTFRPVWDSTTQTYRFTAGDDTSPVTLSNLASKTELNNYVNNNNFTWNNLKDKPDVISSDSTLDANNLIDRSEKIISSLYKYPSTSTGSSYVWFRAREIGALKNGDKIAFHIDSISRNYTYSTSDSYATVTLYRNTPLTRSVVNGKDYTTDASFPGGGLSWLASGGRVNIVNIGNVTVGDLISVEFDNITVEGNNTSVATIALINATSGADISVDGKIHLNISSGYYGCTFKVNGTTYGQTINASLVLCNGYAANASTNLGSSTTLTYQNLQVVRIPYLPISSGSSVYAYPRIVEQELVNNTTDQRFVLTVDTSKMDTYDKSIDNVAVAFFFKRRANSSTPGVTTFNKVMVVKSPIPMQWSQRQEELSLQTVKKREVSLNPATGLVKVGDAEGTFPGTSTVSNIQTTLNTTNTNLTNLTNKVGKIKVDKTNFTITDPDGNVGQFLGIHDNTTKKINSFQVSDGTGTNAGKVMLFYCSGQTCSNNLLVAYADSLSTSRTLWGKSFDGSSNVSGDMTGVGSITMSGTLKATSGSDMGADIVSICSSNNRGRLIAQSGSDDVNTTSANIMRVGLFANKSQNIAGQYLYSPKSTALCMYKYTSADIAHTYMNGGTVVIGLNFDNTTNYSSSYKLYVAGNIGALGSISQNSSSDIRLKTDFSQKDYINIILSLGEVVSFRYTPQVKEVNPSIEIDKQHTGLIYQNAVRADIPNFTGSDEKGYGYVNYLSADYQATHLGATQQLAKEVQALKTENESLKQRLYRLERLVDELMKRED